MFNYFAKTYVKMQNTTYISDKTKKKNMHSQLLCFFKFWHNYNLNKNNNRYKFEFIHEIGPPMPIHITGFCGVLASLRYIPQLPSAWTKYKELAETTNDSTLKTVYEIARWQFIPNIILGIAALWSCILILRIVSVL